MLRATTFLAAAVVLASLTAAQDLPKPANVGEAVPAELALAKAAYHQELEKAAEALLKEFGAEEKRTLESVKLKIDDKIKRSEQLADEKKAFEADGKLPKSPGLKVATGDYVAKVTAARTRCERAFDKVAEQVGRTDLTVAKAVLAEKVEFFKPAPPAGQVAAKPGPPNANPLVGTWQRKSLNGTTHKHVTPTHVTIVYFDPTGRVILTHGGQYTLKGDTIRESIDYGFGSGWDSLKAKTVTHTFTLQDKKWACKGFGGGTAVEVWELVEPAAPAGR